MLSGNSKPKNPDEILNEMGIDSSEINKLVETVNKDVQCGPECQKQKKLEELHQKMIKAEKTLDKAPGNLSLARRNYYVFKDGEHTYNAKQNTDYSEEAKTCFKKIEEEFKSSASRTQTMIDEYEAITRYEDNMDNILYSEIDKKEKITKEIDDIKSKIFTNDRRFHYFDESIEWQNKLNLFVMVLYSGLVLYYVLYFLFYQGNYSNRRNIIYGLFLIIFPFIFNFVINFDLLGNGLSIKLILDRIVSIFTGNNYPIN